MLTAFTFLMTFGMIPGRISITSGLTPAICFSILDSAIESITKNLSTVYSPSCLA